MMKKAPVAWSGGAEMPVAGFVKAYEGVNELDPGRLAVERMRMEWERYCKHLDGVRLGRSELDCWRLAMLEVRVFYDGEQPSDGDEDGA